MPGEPAVIEYLGLRYSGPRRESNLQFRGPVSDEQIDLARAQHRIERLPPDLPILILGREADHLQYQWGPRRGTNGYQPNAIQQATLERVVGFLNQHLSPQASSVPRALTG